MRMTGGAFAAWAPEYAERGIATFPVHDDKRPAVRGYGRVGCKGSLELAAKFPEASAFGFCAGKNSGVTVLDIDNADEGALADAMGRHGESPLVVRTGGGYHAYYRHEGERRRIRIGRDIDLIGSGAAIAAPSRTAKGDYSIIRGSLDDLDRLPPIAGLTEAQGQGGRVECGRRNDELWRHCMRQARFCDTLAALIDVAQTFAGDMLDRQHGHDFTDAEVIATAQSAWEITESGRNRFGQFGAWFTSEEVGQLIANDQRAFLLLAFLRANNGPNAEFMIANGLAETLRWNRHTLAETRKRLLNSGYIRQARKASTGIPALYRWTG